MEGEELGALLQGRAIVDQRVYRESENGCGPASVLNFLQFGNETYRSAYGKILGGDDEVRMRFVIDRYFRNRRSTIHPGQSRWGVHGIEAEDLLAGVNELLVEQDIEPVRGVYLDREEGESEEELIARVHRLMERSLGRGVAPILSLRSFFVGAEEKEGPGWSVGRHHNVVVLRVSRISPGLGFEALVLDPWEGKPRRVFLHREANGQPFRALKGNQERGDWLGGQPFLQVVAPGMSSLRPKELEWSDRLLVIANYLIGGF